MTEEVKEVTQPTPEESWDQVSKDRASTPAEDVPAEAKEPTKDDPMAGLPEPTRKLIEGLKSENDRRFKEVNQRLATAHGTIGNMKQRLDESQERLKTMTPTVEAVAAEKKAAEKVKADEKLAKRKALRERLNDLPDVAELMDEVLPVDAEPTKEAAKPEAKPEVKPEVKPAALPADEKALLISQRELSDLHPKWIETINSEEYAAWSKAQPEDIRALAESNDVKDADQMLTLFKKHKSDAAKVAQVEKDRAERLRRGESVQGRGSSIGDVDTSPDALWNKVSRDRAKAQAA